MSGPPYGQDRLYFEYDCGDIEVRRVALCSPQLTQPQGLTGVFFWPLFQKWYSSTHRDAGGISQSRQSDRDTLMAVGAMKLAFSDRVYCVKKRLRSA